VYFVSDATIGLRWKAWELDFLGTNIFDSRYRLGEYNFVSDFRPFNAQSGAPPQPTLTPARAFTAGAPQMLFLSLSATLGGA
jgi:hypothetical protein